MLIITFFIKIMTGNQINTTGDIRTITVLINHRLEIAGFRKTEHLYCSGRDIKIVMNSIPPSIAIIDCKMPGMNGVKFSQEIVLYSLFFLPMLWKIS